MRKKQIHVLFDWNGTLLDDMDICLEGMNRILTAEGLNPLTPTRYREIFTFPVRNYYQLTGLSLENGKFEHYSYQFVNYYEQNKHRARLFADVLPTLHKLHRNKIACSLLSAYPQEKLQQMVETFHLQELFRHVVGLDNIFAGSKLERAKELVNNAQLQNSQLWLVGDTLHDFEVGKEIGAQVILIPRGHQHEKRLKQTSAILLPDLTQIANIIER